MFDGGAGAKFPLLRKGLRMDISVIFETNLQKPSDPSADSENGNLYMHQT